MIENKDPKIVKADAERTKTHAGKQQEAPRPSSSSRPSSSPPPAVHEDQEEHDLFMPDSDDETDFYKIVNDDIEMQENADALNQTPTEDTPTTNAVNIDFEHEHATIALLDVLQLNGVSPVTAANYAASLARNRPRFENLHRRMVNAKRFIASLTDRSPTFMELYGRGKLIEAAHGCRRNLNLHGLDALDLRTCMDDGTPWDFNNAAHRRKARHMVETLKPTWLIGSPPCTAFTKLNWAWNYKKMDPADVQAKIEEGRRHLHFVIGLYQIQIDQGRHFLHEHPESALSWKDDWMVRLLRHPRVKTVVSDQCEYGLVTWTDHGGMAPAKKPTRWATTSDQMVHRLSKRCTRAHEHQPLLSGRAADAAFCPLPLITKNIAWNTGYLRA